MPVKPRLGIIAWLTILVLGAVIPLLLFAGFTLRGVLHSSRALADRGQVDTARALALAVEGEVRSWKASVAALAESRSIQPGRWAEFYEEARQVGLQHDGWVVLTVSSGDQIFNTLLPYGAPLHKTSSPETINAIFRYGKPIVSDLFWGKNAQRHLVAVAVPVVRGGKVVNCLTLNFSPDRLTRLLQSQQLPATWVAALNDSQRHVVARSRDAEARVGKPVVEWFAAATRAAERGIVTGPMIDGRLGQIAFERLHEAAWVVALAIPVAELHSAVPIWGFLSIGAILGLVAVGMAVYMGRRMTGPVKSLARASESLLRGEAGDIGRSTAIREVQELQQALVKASAAARTHAAEREQAAEALHRANEALEARVAERTAALASANEALLAANADLQEEIAQRKRAEGELRSLNAELDQRVRERTAELAATVELLQKEAEERVAAEQGTYAERQRLYDVLETLPVYVVLMSKDYHVPFVNRFFRERFGESHGRRCFEYLFERNEPCENCESYTPLKTGASHHWEWTGPDGRNYDIYDFPFADTDGSRLILEMGIDVTERKQAETALKAAHAELAERADRLRALAGEIALAEQRERSRLADVLHDELQQLLVATRLRAHMLGQTSDPEVQQGAREIDALVEEALGQTRSLTSELSPPALRSGRLLPALEWLVRWVKERHRLAVRLAPPPVPLPRVPEDTAILLYQAVRECLLNTVKHAHVGAATVTVVAAESTLTVTVADAGVGFDPTRLRVTGGTEGGVGLLGIHERLESVGGRLEIASTPGGGSRVTLVAPLGRTAMAPAIPSAVLAEAASGSGVPRRLRVLVVDDRALVRRGFATLLEGEPDLEVVGEADNGKQAIELTRQLTPDVVLMDIGMPVMNGIEATRAILAEFPALRVIGLSMVEDPAQAEAMLQAGAVGYLRKSEPAEALLAVIRGAGGPTM